MIHRAHPLHAELRQVIVGRHQVRAPTGESIQVQRQCGDQRLAFTGLHLGDLAAMQHSSADELHVEMAHARGAPAGLADQGERLRQNLLEDLLLDLPNLLLLIANPYRHLGAGRRIRLPLPNAAHVY